MTCVAEWSAYKMCERLFMSSIVARRTNLMYRDMQNEISFSGDIENNTVMQLNGLLASKLPLFLSEQGDPNFDAHSGTPPYIMGVMLNRPDII